MTNSRRSTIKASVLAIALIGGGLATSAQAADLAARYVKAPAAAVGAAWDWSGFYLGGDLGGVAQSTANGRSDFFQPAGVFANNPQTQAPSSSAVIGGVHAGYNWQMSHLVVGVEGDWQWTNANYSFCRQTDKRSLACSDNRFGFISIDSETRAIGTIRGRLGYAFDRVLIYGTGGVAFADLRANITADCRVAGCGAFGITNLTSGNSSMIRTGWVAGAGAEWMLSPNWIVRSEYLHVDVGSVSDTLNLAPKNCDAPCGASWSRSYRYDIGRIGFSYKFGGPAAAAN